MSFLSTTGKSNHLIEQASDSADHALRAAQQAVTGAVDSVRQTSHHLRIKAEHASDTTISYIRDEPVKAVLIAAATGAAIMALVNLMSRSRDRR